MKEWLFNLLYEQPFPICIIGGNHSLSHLRNFLKRDENCVLVADKHLSHAKGVASISSAKDILSSSKSCVSLCYDFSTYSQEDMAEELQELYILTDSPKLSMLFLEGGQALFTLLNDSRTDKQYRNILSSPKIFLYFKDTEEWLEKETFDMFSDKFPIQIYFDLLDCPFFPHTSQLKEWGEVGQGPFIYLAASRDLIPIPLS